MPSSESSDASRPGIPPWLASAATGSLSGALFLVTGLLALLAPVPLVISYRRMGLRAGLRASLAGAAFAPLLAVVGGLGESGALSFVAVGFLFAVALPALLLAAGMAVAQDSSGALVLAVSGYLAVLLGLTLAVEAFAGGGIGSQASIWIDRTVSTFTEAFNEAAVRDVTLVPRAADLQARPEWYRLWGLRLLPSLSATGVVLGFWLNLVYVRWFIGGRGEEDDLCRWRLPGWVIFGFMACMAGVAFQVGPIGGAIPRWNALLVGASNGLVFLFVLYWLQGVAVVNHHFLRLPLGPGMRLLGVAAQALLMLFPLTSVLYGATGLADAWYDLRNLDGPSRD